MPRVGRERLAARRRALGLSQEELAHRLGVERSTVGRWEQATSTPRPQQRRPLAALLELSLDQLDALLADVDRPAAPLGAPVIAAAWTQRTAGTLADAILSGHDQPITPAAAPRLVHEWLVVEPPQKVELRAGRRVGASLASQAARRVDQLRHLDDVIAGADLQGIVERELAATAGVVRHGTYSDAVGRRLLATLGDLCQLAGWAAADAGMGRLAMHYYATGIASAHAAGDKALAGQLITTLAYQLANTGRARDAVLLAQSAVAGCHGQATGTTMALLLERLAWAYARSKDRPHTERMLGEVDDHYANRNPADDPQWAYWLTSEEVDVMAGRCFVELKQPHRAMPLLERALSAYDDDRPREAALYLSWLAEARYQAGDIEGAANLGCDVLDLVSHTASTRSSDRARHLQHLLRPHRGLPAVDEFQDRYRAAV